jgi:hypothetical protein
VKKHPTIYLDFEIDKLTNSIENVITGDSFATEISLLTKEDLKIINKKNQWSFNWKNEFIQPDRTIYKLTIVSSPNVIQGLISLTAHPIEKHVYMNLIESAPFNKGKNKVYNGVAGNLVAFACKLSFQTGGQGFVSFVSKTKLITHYVESLGATHFGGHLMIITPEAALKLTGKYFK